ncbi:MAG: Stk1 family PASTA domain-containing Ser/Thr kinase [Limnochordales bacterium]|nr:Stk1 family PASTA domain-containing Ser/Thr kinase [Limnochordales bacterium]
MIRQRGGDQVNVLAQRYRLEEKIGAGGMAEVYKGIDTLLGRPVAVKILRAQYASDLEFVRRFRREARAAASLTHPNVVNVYDVGSEGDTHYIVMEYVEGITLKELIRKAAPLPPATAALIAAQVAEALRHAHQRGLVHRDIKPHNILITSDGRVKVTDFGIARAAASVTMTETGIVLGSVHYFSPEQARGEPATAVSDIYSLGVVLFEMLTGHLPFTGESPVAVALQHIQQEPPSVRYWNRHVPRRLEQVVERCLQKDPTRRYQDAGELLADLEPLAAGAEPPTALVQRGKDEEESQLLAGRRGEAAEATRRFSAEEELAGRDEAGGPPGLQETLEAPIPSRRRTWWWVGGLLAALLLVGVAVSGPLLNWFFPEMVRVPDVVGLTVEDARQRLREQRLRLGEETHVFSDEYPAGVIISQDPVANTRTRANRTVWVRISKGPELIEVPDVVGLTRRQAEALLAQKGLQARVSGYEFSERIPQDSVITQSPAAGSYVERGGTVDIVLSQGVPPPTQLTVPDVRGMSLVDAQALLEAQGFQVGNIWSDFRPELPDGVVTEQRPPAGEQLEAGWAVDLIVNQLGETLPSEGTTTSPPQESTPEGSSDFFGFSLP